MWSYYKVILVILLAVILVVYTAGVMIRNGKENTVLSIVIVDAEKNDDEAAEELEKQFLHMAVILVVYTAGVMIRNGKENTVLSIVIVDAEKNDDEAAEELEKQFLHILGADGKYDHVETVLSASSVQTEENIAKLRVSLSVVGEADLVICSKEVYEEYASQGAFADETALLGADAEKDIAKLRVSLSVVGEADLVICSKEVYEEYASQGAFADETALLGADAEKVQAYMTDGQIDLSKCPENFLSESVSYSPAYLCVLEHTERSEAAEAVLKALIR